MICLGIESTAHTFSVGLITDTGKLLGLSSDTYMPSEGGLKPIDVVEHHYNCYDSLLKSALIKAKIRLKEVGLIAFSQGPGLGPCLRVGAAVARALSLKLNIPLVGVNHCIAHIEIGREMCGVEDPVTLYVSGGNTIISAFDSDHYQVFGETLDLPIGNMLDMVAREIGIPHPGGPRMESLSKLGKKYFPLPYIVKGMDLSFSGLYSKIRSLLRNPNLWQKEYTQEDLIYSLQETSFAMLTEVFERAIAHTEKKSVLLTGGVAANQRLQEMISIIAKNHDAEFHVVPLKVAGDNGAMIAWAGIQQFHSGGADLIDATKIKPKWRMDQVPIPWKKEVENRIYLKQSGQNFPVISDTLLAEIRNLNFSHVNKILRKGAEATLFQGRWFERDVVVKFRSKKPYRVEKLDIQIRKQRTLIEGRALLSLAKMGFPVPPVYEVIPSEGIIVMKFLQADRLKDRMNSFNSSQIKKVFQKIGRLVATLHLADHMHGDLTTSNILYTDQNELFFIDFGLAKRDIGIEEMAMDIHLFKRVLQSTHGALFDRTYPAFIEGYQNCTQLSDKMELILSRVDHIELRGRYIAKDKRRKELH
ncbi:bifunctional N(6)-L-threonylcarbamoyladenine synthase/serine/threonine protein kinase [Candidatus Lokiarchaeum ossiferum]|uniref:bifunctional N(6)-L-threonylcarbamoyladenine synthase/serine/threonine protein kinase n=1 Tax=Candidatus Lokiarchaeum ossiferum TaxID=2951803 RepID=UPI00352BE43A